MNIDDLTIRLRAIDATKNAFSSVNKKLANLRKSLAPTVKLFTGLAAATVGVIGTFNLFQGGIDNLAKTADKLGIATEELQAIRQAASFAGIATSELDVALQRMLRRVSEVANTGKGTAASALSQLNLDAKELISLKPEEQLQRILSGLEGIGNSNDKIALAFKFFDSGGVNLIRLTSEAVEEARLEMQALGLAVNRIDASKIETANDNLQKMNLIFRGFKERIAINLADPISALIGVFVDLRKEAALSGNELANTTGSAIVVTQTIAALVAAVNNFKLGFQGLITLIAIGVGRMVENVLGSIATIAEAIPFGDKIGESLRTAEGDVKFFTEGAMLQFEDLESQIVDIFGDDGVVSRIEEKFKTLNEQRELLVNNSSSSISSDAGASAASQIAPEVLGDDLEGGVMAAYLSQLEAASLATEQMRNSISTSMDWVAEVAKTRSQQMRDSIASVGQALGVAASAFKQYADSAGANSEKAFKAYKGLQIAAATASAYSAAAQALADFSSLSTVEKIGRAASVLAIGLGYVSNISRLTASGSGAGGSSGGSSSSASSGPIGGTVQSQQQAQSKVTVSVEGLGTNRDYDDDDIERIFEGMRRAGIDVELLAA